MMTIGTMNRQFRPPERFFSAGADGGAGGGGGGGGGGGVRQICWVGDASAGDCGRGIRLVGPSAGGPGGRNCAGGGSGRLGGGGWRLAGSGGRLPLSRQPGCPGRWGGVICAILPHAEGAGAHCRCSDSASPELAFTPR